jgi:CheY-like chemotaxis protein
MDISNDDNIEDKAVEDILTDSVEEEIIVEDKNDSNVSISSADLNAEFEIADKNEVKETTLEIETKIEEKIKPEPIPATKPEGGTANKIVVVDDSIVIRKMVELALEDNGFEIVGYSKAKDLFDNIDKDKPAIAIIDLALSDMNGVEVLMKIKNTKGIPVLMFASKNAPADMEKAESSGCDGFIQKPFKDEDLLEKVKSLI